MRSMSVESLLWPQPVWSDQIRSLFEDEQDTTSPERTEQKRNVPSRRHLRPWNLDSDRYKTWRDEDVNSTILWNWLMKGKGRRPARGDRTRHRSGPASNRLPF